MSIERVVGSTIVGTFPVYDVNDALLSGLSAPGDFTLTLYRQSGSTMIAASETVSSGEVGSTGIYYFSFAPDETGEYFLLVAILNAGASAANPRFDYTVVSAGAVFSPAYSEAFCAESDIERWVQTAIDSTTSPSDTEAAAFAEARAATIMSLCAGWGFTVTPSTVTAGSRIEDMLREANAIGAALDYTIAQQFGNSPSKSDRAEALMQLWQGFVGDQKPGMTTRLVGSLETEIRGNLASLSTDHILSGDTVAYSEGSAPTNDPIGISMGSLF